MIQIKDRRCAFCNWLNKETRESFVCANCGKSSAGREEVAVIVEEVEESDNWLEEIDKIKGIGNETLSDISRIYPSKDALVGALKDDTCPFRNDVVQKLKLSLIK